MGSKQLLVKLTLVTLSFWGAYAFTKAKTDGFSLRKISTEERFATQNLSDLSPLNQPYHYLGSGAQNFAFVSEDGKWVLKFYKHYRATHPLKFLALCFPKNLQERLQRTIAKRESKRKKDFHSYDLALKHLKEETGLLTLFGGGELVDLRLTLYDPIGVRHLIRANSFPFILQKKADPLYPTIQRWIKVGDEESLTLALKSLVSLLRSRCHKGIGDKDPDLKTNFGFLETQAIQFDIGRFFSAPELKEESKCQGELFRVTAKLREWLREMNPAYEEVILKEIFLD